LKYEREREKDVEFREFDINIITWIFLKSYNYAGFSLEIQRKNNFKSIGMRYLCVNLYYY
jgi:hypothetical protein